MHNKKNNADAIQKMTHFHMIFSFSNDDMLSIFSIVSQRKIFASGNMQSIVYCRESNVVSLSYQLEIRIQLLYMMMTKKQSERFHIK